MEAEGQKEIIEFLKEQVDSRNDEIKKLLQIRKNTTNQDEKKQIENKILDATSWQIVFAQKLEELESRALCS